jgi:cytochrome c-type protein NapC
MNTSNNKTSQTKSNHYSELRVRQRWHSLFRFFNTHYLITMTLFLLAGLTFWGSFNWLMHATNNEEFCISCHEMKDNVYKEYKTTVHFSNRTGVKASCPDCHVPKQWIHMLIRKVKAANEIYHKLAGSIDTKEKFEEKRLELAQTVWTTMQQTDSRECRNCHQFKSMNLSKQAQRSTLVHQYAIEKGKTCINCHKGIAHHLPKGIIVERGGSNEDHAYYEIKKLACFLCHLDMPKPIIENWGF